MSLRLSVIVCTFNPSPPLISRCLLALAAAQQAAAFDVEIILVDNNSHPPLGDLESVKAFLAGASSRRMIVEPTPGLTNARLAGLKVARAGALIFVDDDNLLEPEYLSAALALLERLRDVGVLGPGVIGVQWEDGTPRWIRGYAACFQERHATTARFESVAGWPEFYPTGTGMVVRREVLDEYARHVAAGSITATGRKGAQLTSAEDAQIIWTAVRMGLSAGTSPNLRLTHFVERRKAKLGYILRMVFATMASGRIALRESFPERPELWTPPGSLAAQRSILGTALKQLLLLRVRSGPVQLVRVMGDLHGQFLAARREPPWMTRLAAGALGFSWMDN